MKLSIPNKDLFLNNFLISIGKIAESATLKITPGRIDSLVSTSDNTGIISISYEDSSIDCEAVLNIPDVKKLCRVLQCIETPGFELSISSNNISYTSKTIRFKYHLYDDGIVTVPKIDLKKLETIDFDSKFTLAYSSLTSLVKGSTIATDTNKIYLTFIDNEVHGELTDHVRANTDSYGLLISSDYTGKLNSKPLPLNFEIFRIISSMKFTTSTCNIASLLGVMTFNIELEKTKIKFIISALAN
jgi:hypothetical protein